jgi:hypothetical protein
MRSGDVGYVACSPVLGRAPANLSVSRPMAPSRDTVVSVLQVLSSKDAQYEILLHADADPERRQPVNVADELWNLWTKSYSPRSEFPGDINESLDRFTAFFRDRRSLLPDRFASLMTDVHWLGVIEYAKVLLARLAEVDDVANRER